MKKLFFVALLCAAMLAQSCQTDVYDDSSLRTEIDDLKDRVSTLEELCEQMNTNISSLQTIVNALQTNDYITSVTPIMSGGQTVGYTITFAFQSPITIYHGTDGSDGKDGTNGKDGTDGSDGTTPSIGVAMYTDGLYYWTLNGEWLKDNFGNKIKAEGLDGSNGQNGIAPILKIEDGRWMLSNDNGRTWSDVGQATGDSMFLNVEVKEDSIVFTLADNTVITVPRGSSLKPLSVEFEQDGYVAVLPGHEYTIGYQIIGADENTIINVIAQDGYVAKLTAKSNSTGQIRITTPNPAPDSRILVLISNSERTMLYNIIIAESIISVVQNLYEISSEGGDIEIELSTNVDNYTVHIPDTVTEWITVTQATRGAMRTEDLCLTVIPNPNDEWRYATIELRDASELVKKSFQIAQYPISYEVVHLSADGTSTSRLLYTPERWSKVSYLKFTGTLVRTSNLHNNLIAYPQSYYTNNLESGCLEVLDLSELTNTEFISNHFAGDNRKVKTVILPQRLEAINQYLFYGNTNIISVVIPETVRIIEDEAFYKCENLSIELNIPHLESIGKFAFLWCRNLKGAVIPDRVSIGEEAFLDSFSTGAKLIIEGNFSEGKRAFVGVKATDLHIGPNGRFPVLGDKNSPWRGRVFYNKSIPPYEYGYSFNEGIFGSSDRISILYVPIGAKQGYEDNYWSRGFTQIIETKF